MNKNEQELISLNKLTELNKLVWEFTSVRHNLTKVLPTLTNLGNLTITDTIRQEMVKVQSEKLEAIIKKINDFGFDVEGYDETLL